MKAIIFDFDGVILDSVDVKTKAFKQMYSIYGDAVMRKVVDYHLLNGGISRYEKFKYFHENFLNISLSNTEVDHMASEFSKIVFKKVCNSEYIKGALEFLKSKVEIIKNIMIERKLNANEILFIGDAMTDYNASHETNLNFIGIRNKDTVFPKDVLQINDLMEIINIKNL